MINTGDLTLNISKAREDDAVNKDRYDDVSVVNALEVLNDIARRLQDVEKQIQLKVDNDKILSGIIIGEEALLISSDKVAIVGEVTFADYVRDQNGQATGQVDPKITQIIGDKIRTGSIISNNWSANRGTVLDLDNGNILIGGYDDPNLTYYSSTNEMNIKGKVNIDDLDEGNTGQLVTGDAYWNGFGSVAGTDYYGTGVIVGTNGIAGLFQAIPGESFKDTTELMFAFNANNGNAYFGGELTAATGTFNGNISAASGTFTGNINTNGYVEAAGITDYGFTLPFGAYTYNAQGAMFGDNTAENSANKVTIGVAGRCDGVISVSSASALGVYGASDVTGSSDGFGAGVLGYGDGPNGYGVVASSEDDIGLYAVTLDADSVAIYGVSTGSYGVMGKGLAGVLGRSDYPGTHFGVFSDGKLGTSERLIKEDSTKGTLKLYNNTTGVLEHTYKYTFE